MDAQVFSLFPTPLYVKNYGGNIDDVINYFDSCEMSETGHGYGMISKNSYILDNPICDDLNLFFMSCFKEFATQ